MMRPALPAAALLLVAAPPALAGGLRPEQVPADAAWVVHIDVEAMTGTALGRFVLDHEQELDLDLDEVKREIGIDPARDIHSATLFGRGAPEDDGTVILEMSAAVDNVIEMAAKETPYRRIEVDGITVHRWREDDQTTYAWVGPAASPERRTVILGERRRHVTSLVRLLDGGPSFANTMREHAGPTLAPPSAGSLLWIVARDLSWVEADGNDPTSSMIQRAGGCLVEVRERAGTTTFRLVGTAADERDARNIGDVLRGIIALGRLAADAEPGLDEFNDLLNGISIAVENRAVEVSIDVPSDEIAAQLEAAMRTMD